MIVRGIVVVKPFTHEPDEEVPVRVTGAEASPLTYVAWAALESESTVQVA